jgi:hypothetical protein
MVTWTATYVVTCHVPELLHLLLPLLLLLCCRVSEQRAVNLLDDLCSTMDDYTMVPREDSSSSSTGSKPATETEAADTGSPEGSSSDQTASAGNSKKSKKKSKKAGAAKRAVSAEMEWVKYQGDGKINVAKSRRWAAAHTIYDGDWTHM